MAYRPQGSIKQWVAEDRPREKLLQRGATALTDKELLAIILGSGTRELSAVDLAAYLIQHFGSLSALARAGVQDLMEIRGIGEAKALGIVAAFEVARRKGMELHQDFLAEDPEAVAHYLQPRMGDLQQEVFHVIFVNNSNRMLAEETLFRGGIGGLSVDVRVIFQRALRQLATGIIVSHNHPSGQLTPSAPDIELTGRIRQAGEVLNIRLLDHLIITAQGYFSFADEGLL